MEKATGKTPGGFIQFEKRLPSLSCRGLSASGPLHLSASRMYSLGEKWNRENVREIQVEIEIDKGGGMDRTEDEEKDR